MGNTWVISDPHFSHANILNFKREDGVTPLRPFASVEKMDETLINNWNDVVSSGDRVYLLGDVAFHHRTFRSIIPRLRGRICLIPGNHEPKRSRQYFGLFDDVRGYIVGKGYVMSHIPVHPSQLEYRWKINIHGHTHAHSVTSMQPDEGTYTWSVQQDPRYYCACVEQIDYRPKLLDDILKERGLK